MSTKEISISVARRWSQTEMITGETDAKAVAAWNVESNEARAALDAALNDGYRVISSALHDDIHGQYMFHVLHKPDEAPPTPTNNGYPFSVMLSWLYSNLDEAVLTFNAGTPMELVYKSFDGVISQADFVRSVVGNDHKEALSTFHDALDKAIRNLK